MPDETESAPVGEDAAEGGGRGVRGAGGMSAPGGGDRGELTRYGIMMD